MLAQAGHRQARCSHGFWGAQGRIREETVGCEQVEGGRRLEGGWSIHDHEDSLPNGETCLNEGPRDELWRLVRWRKQRLGCGAQAIDGSARRLKSWQKARRTSFVRPRFESLKDPAFWSWGLGKGGGTTALPPDLQSPWLFGYLIVWWWSTCVGWECDRQTDSLCGLMELFWPSGNCRTRRLKAVEGLKRLP